MTTTIQGSDQVLDSDGAILKTDEKGRVRTPAARRESLLDEFERSGLSGTKFAALGRDQISRRLPLGRRSGDGSVAAAATDSAGRDDPVRWLEAVVEAAGPGEYSWRPGVGAAVAGRRPGGNQRCEAGGLGGGVAAGPGQAMLSFSGSLKVFVAVEACDMRKGFNGLHALVTERLGEDPRAGHVVCVQQPAAHADQNSLLGRNRDCGC